MNQKNSGPTYVQRSFPIVLGKEWGNFVTSRHTYPRGFPHIFK